MRNNIWIFGIMALALTSCGDKKQDPVKENLVIKDSIISKEIINSVLDSTEEKVKNFLITGFLKDEIKFLKQEDRKFQYENIDLNGDNIPETFVRFSSSYFCGSGGCTFLLLDENQKIITKFTVMDAPIYVEKTIKNGWAVLVIRDHGVLKELFFDGKKYPSNPSMLEKSGYNAPSPNATVVFEKPFTESKITTF